MSKIKISVIIVHYKVKERLFECLSSIYQHSKNVSFEIIVVDNDEVKNIQKDLFNKFPKVKYIPSPKNVGYGAGNNLGVKNASGEFIFVLNPDTLLTNNVLKILSDFLDKKSKYAIAAPLLLDENKKIYPLQGTEVLSPLKAIFSLSVINKVFPNNIFAKNYWLKNWTKKEVKNVGTVPGTAFLIRKDIFKKVGGFDEKFFLYFEEHDICLRILKRGLLIAMNPEAKIIHHWGKSTSKSTKNINKIFNESRFYYFKKNFGLVAAILVELFLRLGKTQIVLMAAILLGAFLRFYEINQTFYLIPDAGWFYLSARDLIVDGKIPLVGPPTSHPWIHHGPLWTYTLAILLYLFNFNPIMPAYYMASLGVLTIYIMYKVASTLFSERVGMIAVFLYASAPLVIRNSQNPYHTSPIPFFSLLFIYSLYQWVHNRKYYFLPITTFLIGVLYNHEITTIALSGIVVPIVFYGLVRKKRYITDLFNKKKIVLLSITTLLIPMIPFIIYDISHGYRQTFVFFAWLVYRIVKFPIALFQPSTDGSAMSIMNPEFAYFLRSIFFAENTMIAVMLLFISVVFPALVFGVNYKNKKLRFAEILLFASISVALLGLFMHRVPIEADWMLVVPFLIISLSVFFSKYMNHNRNISYMVLGVVVSIVIINSYFHIHYQNMKSKTNTIGGVPIQIVAADEIIRVSGKKEYNLVGKGVLDNFPVFTNAYDYLTWWRGHGPSKEKVKLKIIVNPVESGINVYTLTNEK